MFHRAKLSLRPIVLAAALACLATAAVAQQGEAPPEAAPTVVLDTSGFWRMHNVLQPPVIAMDEGPTPIVLDAKWLDAPTAEPAAAWRQPGFDDGGWMRAPLLRFSKTPYLARLCLRGKFAVDDPAKVRDLKLTLDYYGGAIVCLNGTEIARGHLPQGDVGRTTLAEAYPREAFAVGDTLIGERGSAGEATKTAQRIRLRSLADVVLPAKLLRKGVNVVAVEIVRAPYHKAQESLRRPKRGSKELSLQLMWNTCEVRRLQVTAASSDGLTPCAVRPAGMQVYNSDLMMSDFDMDWGDPNERLRPVRIVSPRNGRFSGKVVVGCDEPLKGLKAAAGELSGPGGAKIPASAVRLRYAVPHGSEYIITPYSDQQPIYPCVAEVLTALLDEPLDEFPVVARESGRYDLNTPNQPKPVFGAVAPVWITVYVPKDAAVGTYKGQVRISAAGHESVSVPVELKVVDWTVPDTHDYRTWVDLVESPDTLAAYYKVPLWSEEHWRMIGEAFKAIGEAGSRMVYVPLIAQTNIGHEQSMVRWIRKADGSYDYDLSVMDRYLDTAVSQMGRPKIVALWIWEIYMMKNEQIRKDHLWLQQAGEARKEFLGKGPLVTIVDAKTGELSTEHLPPYDDPASKALWQPLIDKVNEHLKARGLEDTVMFGMLSDQRPTKEEVAFIDGLRPGTPWALHGHFGVRANTKFQNIAKVDYQAIVWSVHFAADASMHGWNRPNLVTHYDRDRALNPKTPVLWYHLGEMCITGDQRGIGRLGADIWPLYQDKRGRWTGYIWQRYIQSSWRNLDLHSYCMAPGPHGPVTSTRYECLREGVEHCEARIVIEEALLKDDLRARLGEALAARCQAVLDERQQAMARGLHHFQMNQPSNRGFTEWRAGDELPGQAWFVGSPWQQRSEELFTLAGQVAAKLAQQ